MEVAAIFILSQGKALKEFSMNLFTSLSSSVFPISITLSIPSPTYFRLGFYCRILLRSSTKKINASPPFRGLSDALLNLNICSML